MSTATAFARSRWLTPGLLLALTAIPIAAGLARLIWLATGEVRPDSARFADMPLPLVLHILSIIVFGILGAFQVTPALRRRWPRWHRIAGKIVVVAGTVAAFTGLWMTLNYAGGVNDGPALFVLRLVFGSAMAACLLLGLDAIRRRKFIEHGAWMLRAYAIGMGAGTQVLTFIPWLLLIGPTDEDSRAVLMGAGWVINIVIAELIIRRPTHASRPQTARNPF